MKKEPHIEHIHQLISACAHRRHVIEQANRGVVLIGIGDNELVFDKPYRSGAWFGFIEWHVVAVTLAYSRTKSYFYVYYVLKIFTGMVCEGSVQCLALAYVVNDFKKKKKTPFSFFTLCRLLWNVDSVIREKIMDYDPLLGPRVSGSWADLNVDIWPEYNPFWKGRVEFHLLGSLQAELTRFPPWNHKWENLKIPMWLKEELSVFQ